jgi:hypothetical protein
MLIKIGTNETKVNCKFVDFVIAKATIAKFKTNLTIRVIVFDVNF